MTARPISESLRRFILTSVPSVPFVEALLIFRDAGRARVTIEQLSGRLYIDARRTAEIVEQLRGAGIIEALPEASGWRYAPAAELAPVLDELAQRYRSSLVEVTELIHSSTGRMAHRFADAFKWRKD
jgi:hypothetical protein